MNRGGNKGGGGGGDSSAVEEYFGVRKDEKLLEDSQVTAQLHGS